MQVPIHERAQRDGSAVYGEIGTGEQEPPLAHVGGDPERMRRPS